MRKSLLWRAWMVVLIMVFTAGVAASQTSAVPFQNTIAWGGPIQPPDVGSPDRVQTTTSSGAYSDTSAAGSGDIPNQNQTPNDSPSDAAQDSPADNTANGTAINPAPANPDNTIRQLGTPFPLQLQPEGLKIGPIYLTSISDSFFYAINTAEGQPTQTFGGNSLGANLIYSKPLGRGTLVVQGREQFSLSELQPYFNSAIDGGFTEQLSDRWSISAFADFTYFQNSFLANPQYLLGYNSAGLVQQTLFVLQRGSTLYESNSIAASYQLSGRTHITLSPLIGATFADQPGGGWTSAHQFGGAVGVTREFTPNLSLGVFYSFSHSVTSGAATGPGWNSQGLGFTFQYLFHQSWSIAGSLAASGQVMAKVWTESPTGTVRVMKKFNQSSVYGAYTRSEASNVFVSAGYFDQADIGYSQSLARKTSISGGVGAYRTILTGTHQEGKRASVSVSHQLHPRLSLNAGYSFAHQSGLLTSNFSPFLGNLNYFNVGVTWFLGARSGL